MKMNLSKKINIQSFIFFIFILMIQFAASAQPAANIVKISVAEKSLTVKQGEQFSITLLISVKPSWHINSNKPNDEFLIPSVITAQAKEVTIVSVKYPQAHDTKLSFSEELVSVYEGESSARVTLKTGKKTVPGKQKVTLTLEYQACNNSSCLAPTSTTAEFEIDVIADENLIETKDDSDTTQVDSTKADTTTVMNNIIKDTFKNQNIENSTTQSLPPKNDEGTIASTLENSGLFLSLIFVFLAGLALNLTPCVYPLIPITIGYFGGQAEGNTKRLVLLGVLYMLGMALTYSVVGVVTALSGAVFGTLLQNPFVITGIAILFVVLALSQFGVYEFKLPDSLVAKAGGAKGGVFGAFFMGLTMGIVAAPCIGPVVLGLVTYVAAKGDPLYGFLIFFVLALGLGFPYLLLAIFSGKIKSLPRAGLWMEGVKHIFGLLLIGMAFYFLDPILPKSIQGYPLPVFGIIAALILLFADKTANDSKGFRYFKTVFSVIIIAISIYSLIPKEQLEPEWNKFSLEGYEKSLENAQPMVIDFYADWCIPCKELDALTFSNPEVIEKLENFTLYKVDMTKNNDINEQLRKNFDVIGMPTVLIIDSQGNEVERITGFVDAEEFLSLLNNVELNLEL